MLNGGATVKPINGGNRTVPGKQNELVGFGSKLVSLLRGGLLKGTKSFRVVPGEFVVLLFLFAHGEIWVQ